jgi:hypothetical protein
MSLDKEETPIGLKVIQFLTTNIFWYSVFSLIYLNIDCTEWWLVQSSWGRAVIVFFELVVYYSIFKKKNNNGEI